MNDDQLKWETLSSEYIFNSTWLNARKDVCLRKDGQLIEPYFVLEYMPWVSALCITENNEVVLIKQYRHALGRVCIELPGGCVDGKEGFENAINREVLEETGYAFSQCIALGETSPNPSTNNNLMQMFLLMDGKKVDDQKLDKNEQIQIMVISPDELMKLLDENKIIQSMHVTTIFYALKYLRKNRPGIFTAV